MQTGGFGRMSSATAGSVEAWMSPEATGEMRSHVGRNSRFGWDEFGAKRSVSDSVVA
jgi:hypothetical protein